MHQCCCLWTVSQLNYRDCRDEWEILHWKWNIGKHDTLSRGSLEWMRPLSVSVRLEYLQHEQHPHDQMSNIWSCRFPSGGINTVKLLLQTQQVWGLEVWPTSSSSECVLSLNVKISGNCPHVCDLMFFFLNQLTSENYQVCSQLKVKLARWVVTQQVPWYSSVFFFLFWNSHVTHPGEEKYCHFKLYRKHVYCLYPMKRSQDLTHLYLFQNKAKKSTQ